MNHLWLEAQEAEIAQSDASSKMPVATSLLCLGNDFEGFGDACGGYVSLLLRKMLHGGTTKTDHFEVARLAPTPSAQRKGAREAFLRLLAVGESKRIEHQLFHFLVVVLVDGLVLHR